jgi:CxxC-x17-CxxC domain-containing protein
MNYQDQQLTCRECGASFVFTAGEQEFYAGRGLQNAPSRCPSCRAARRGGGAGASSGGRYDRPARQMTDVICSSCGKPTQVPFVPSGDKPVYCRDCFATMGGGRRSDRY